MLIVFDTCNVGLGPEPEGGVSFIYKNVEGLPPDVSIMVPLAREMVEKLIVGMQEQLGKKILLANLEDLRKATSAQTPPTSP